MHAERTYALALAPSKMATWAPTKARAITGAGTCGCWPRTGEPGTEVLLGVAAQGGQVGLAGGKSPGRPGQFEYPGGPI